MPTIRKDLCCVEQLCIRLEKEREGLAARIGALRSPARRSYLKQAGYLDDLYALAVFTGLCAALMLAAHWLELRFLGAFFRIASCAFLTSFQVVLMLKLAKGKRNADREEEERIRQLRNCEWKMEQLNGQLREARSLYRQMQEALVIPEEDIPILQSGRDPDTLLRDRYLQACGETEQALPEQSKAVSALFRRMDFLQ